MDEFRKVMEVNTIGVFITAQAAARVMRDNPNVTGSIILTASMSGTVVNRDQSWVAYNTSKSAVLQLGRNLAAEWGPYNIRVNTLSPGYFRTPTNGLLWVFARWLHARDNHGPPMSSATWLDKPRPPRAWSNSL